VLALYDSIEDKKWLEIVLSKYKETTPPNIDRPNISSYNYSIPAGALSRVFLFRNQFKSLGYWDWQDVPGTRIWSGEREYPQSPDLEVHCFTTMQVISQVHAMLSVSLSPHRLRSISCTQGPGISLLPTPAVVSRCLGISMATALGAAERYLF
jgi:hypothetical protein